MVAPSGPPVVFVGPSLGIADSRAIMPDAVVLPPARCGDVLSVLRLRPAAIVLVDGFYDTTPAPWHKEVLWALEAGVPVVGAASMGALRAAELEPFGMVGSGRVYESYRDGSRWADDAVAVLQTSDHDGDRALTDALVDIEGKVAALVGAGLLGAADAAEVVSAARRTHFSGRTMAGALTAAGQSTTTARQMVAWLDGHAGSIKRADAEGALRLAAGGLRRPVLAEPLSRTVHILRLAAEVTLRPLGRAERGLPVAEQLLSADEAVARAAGLAGGLLRAADGASAIAEPVDGSAAVGGETLAAAQEIVLAELGDHPAAASSAQRLARLASSWTAPPAGSDVVPVLRALAGPAASPALVEIMASAATRALVVTATPWRPEAEPSHDGLATADALLPEEANGGDPLETAALVGQRRRAAQLMDVVRLGGAVTGPLASCADPFDAPLLDGLAVMRAVGAIPPVNRVLI